MQAKQPFADLEQPRATPSPSLGVPGKRSLTQGLAPRTIVYRDAALAPTGPRDANGVSADAEAAVARAASGGGSPLPTQVQRQFESSLGADLSGVRVHTSGASAEAAHAVGAKAYTVGNDIHFAAGRYQPDDPFGLHLLAHEVAHTVQQAGGAQRRQHKLEVSTPHDAAEHEADRAADAMVRGEAARVAGAGVGVHRDADLVVQAEELGNSAEMRARGEQQAKAYRASPPAHGPMSTTRVDMNSAQAMISAIEAAQGNLGMLQGRENALNADQSDSSAYLDRDNAGGAPFRFDEGARCIATNMAVMGKLREFMQAAGRQDFQHTFFELAYRQLNEDYSKLTATIDVIKERNLTVTGSGVNEDVAAESKADPILADRLSELRAAATELRGFVTEANSGLAGLSTQAGLAFAKLTTETEAMRDVPPPKLEDTKDQEAATQQIEAIRADLSAATATISSIKSVVEASFSMVAPGVGGEIEGVLGGLGGKTVGYLDQYAKAAPGAIEGYGKIAAAQLEGREASRPDGVGLGGADTSVLTSSGAKAALGAGADAAADGVTTALAQWLTNFNTRIAAATGRASALGQLTKQKYENIALSRVANCQADLVHAVAQVALKRKQIEDKKRALTIKAQEVEAQAKKSGRRHGTDIGATAQAFSAVQAFLAQAEGARSLGQQEMEQAKRAGDARRTISGDYIAAPGNQDAHSFGLPETIAQTNSSEHVYWTCPRDPDADNRGRADFSGYHPTPVTIIFVVTEDDKNERSAVMEDRTGTKLKQVDALMAQARAFEGELNAALGPAVVK